MLVARLKSRIVEGTPAIQRLRVLNQFFYRELGFGPNANDYYDPENSYLNAVLQTRRGIPISLAVLLMEIGQQIGLPLKGVSFPNHFLVRMSIPAGEVVIDPLTGQTLSKEELQEMLDPYLEKEGIEDPNSVPLGVFLQVATHREIVARMLRNLKAIYLQESRWQRLLAVQQRLVILLPESIEEVRDRGWPTPTWNASGRPWPTWKPMWMPAPMRPTPQAQGAHADAARHEPQPQLRLISAPPCGGA